MLDLMFGIEANSVVSDIEEVLPWLFDEDWLVCVELGTWVLVLVLVVVVVVVEDPEFPEGWVFLDGRIVPEKEVVPEDPPEDWEDSDVLEDWEETDDPEVLDPEERDAPEFPDWEPTEDPEDPEDLELWDPEDWENEVPEAPEEVVKLPLSTLVVATPSILEAILVTEVESCPPTMVIFPSIILFKMKS